MAPQRSHRPIHRYRRIRPRCSSDPDLDAARARLSAPCESGEETNAQYAGVASDGWGPLDDGGAFLATAEQLVNAADRVGLFGRQVSVLLFITAGTDLVADGALVTASPRNGDDAIGLRLCFYHLDHNDLQWDPASRGMDAALGVLRSAAHHAQHVVQDASRRRGSASS